MVTKRVAYGEWQGQRSFGDRHGRFGQAKHDTRALRHVEFVEDGEMANVLLGRCGGLLDLERVDRAVAEDQQVDLLLVLVSIVVDRRLPAVVPVALAFLGNRSDTIPK